MLLKKATPRTSIQILWLTLNKHLKQQLQNAEAILDFSGVAIFLQSTFVIQDSPQ